MNDTFETVLRRHLTYLAADAPLDPDAALKDLGLDSMRAVDLVFDLEDEALFIADYKGRYELPLKEIFE